MTEQKVIFTGLIPQCPYCQKPTHRTGGSGQATLGYYPPIYDKKGKNINPDKNIQTATYFCCECNKTFSVSGNKPDGYKYKILT